MLFFVTFLAGNVSVRYVEGKAGIVVIEDLSAPLQRYVAGPAVLGTAGGLKLAAMYVLRCVASGALIRRLRKLRLLPGMALYAGDLLMCAIERKLSS